MSTDLLQEVDYPESDGKPIAETPVHMRAMWESIQTLNFWYDADPNVYVWGNMFLYYRRGDPSAAVSPDVMAIFGVDKLKDRRVFKTWEVKRKPSGIIEITSLKTKREDQKDKFILYRDILKVKEYFLFDPLAEYLGLRGYDRLSAPERANMCASRKWTAGCRSKVFNLHLQARRPRSQAFLESRKAILAADDGRTSNRGRKRARVRKAVQTRVRGERP